MQQLVPPEVYASQGENAWALLHDDLLVTLDQLYEAFGPMTVNNWHSGGRFKESGLRLPESTTGAKLSRHKIGQAADVKPINITPQEMYADILRDPSRFPLLTTLEDIAFTTTAPGKGWVHCDVRPATQTGIRIIKP